MTRLFCFFLMLLAVTPLLNGCFGNRAPLIEEQQRVIINLNERALASENKKQEADAWKLLQEALQLALAVDDRDGQCITLLNQARLARKSGQPQRAAQQIDQALRVSEGTTYYPDAAQEKALQELVAKQLDQATRWAETARTAEQGNLMGRRLNLLARIALVKGDTAEAGRFAELALSANDKEGMELERANSLRMLGILKTREKQLDKAEAFLQEALRLDKLQAAPAKIAADLDALAELAGLAQQNARQQEYLNRARGIRENNQLPSHQ